MTLRIAGKHFAGHNKDSYWRERIAPEIDDQEIFYDGFLASDGALQEFLGNARGLIIPSVFDEPFGLVMAEALACGTPLLGLANGAIPEVIREGRTGRLVEPGMLHDPDTGKRRLDESATIGRLADAMETLDKLRRADCRADFEDRFTLARMCEEHLTAYRKLLAAD